MTRETKVGLLIGMGVILLIGIIVTDHLAVEPETDAVPLMVAPPDPVPPPRELDRYRVAEEPAPRRARPEPRVTRPAPLLPPARSASGDHGVPGPGLTTPNRVDPQITRRRLPRPPAPRLAYGPAPGSDPVPADRPHRAEPPAPVHTPPAARNVVHYVKKGETLYSIARDHWGDGNLYPLLVRANVGKINNAGRVREGVRLVIPPHRAAGTPTIVPGAAPPPPGLERTRLGAAGRGARPAAPATPPARRIAVREGDTLSSLAHKHLGAERLWPRLLAANKDVIEDPERLMPGMELVVPALPGGATRAAGPARPAPPVQRTAPPNRARMASYKVKSGDTLSRIAAHLLGDARRHNEIYEANRASLKSPDALVVGMEIAVPRR